MNPYTKSYYETSNYSDYKERGERYHKLAKETTSLLESLMLVNKNCKIIDFGCATGHLLSGLKELGYNNVSGVEISDWARTQCKERGLSVVSSMDNYSDIHFVYALDVLEHMNDSEIIPLLKKTAHIPLIVRIPVAWIEGGGFHLEISRRDPTHINCKTAFEWQELIYSCRGPETRILGLNLNTIYYSDGVFSALII